MFCSRCGTQCENSAAFCSVCGSRLSASAAGNTDADRLLRRIARDVRFISRGRMLPVKLLLIPLGLLLLFGLIAFIGEILSYVNGVGLHR